MNGKRARKLRAAARKAATMYTPIRYRGQTVRHPEGSFRRIYQDSKRSAA